MTDRSSRARLEELIGNIDGLYAGSRERLPAVMAETIDRHDRMWWAMHQLAGDLGSLSFTTKYLALELAATRGEDRPLHLSRDE